MKIKEIQCKSALSKCGLPGGGFCINPYVGCGHACVYCYARFMRRFTNHPEPWGTFIDAKKNVAEVLAKQIKSPKFINQQIYIGTVTDPYQPIEKKYQLTRQILEVLAEKPVSVSILTKSDLILRDLDLLKKIKKLDINFTINTLDKKWQNLVEPNASTISQRLAALKKLNQAGLKTMVMVGPYWPYFTDPAKLIKEFKKAGVSHLFSESFNTVGDNWTGVAKILQKHYPNLYPKMNELMFDRQKFDEFYQTAEKKVKTLCKKHHLSCSIYFARYHATKTK